MYRIDKISNNIFKLEQRMFKDLKIKERDHLQEWIAKNPDIFGEELLIIQKEFDGFNDTGERLDLLALDKNGGLVIIENKLDDTGRNVAWQALKYTSYCSTLTTSQILIIYQDYLDKWSNNERAKENLLEFLERDEEELLLNRDDQRMIFVANNFRKEVTSTVLWLLDHDIRIQCFRATPYSMGEELFLQVEQIIPLPETQEFMIDAKEKEKEKRGKSKAVEESEARLIKFWTALKEELDNHNVDFLNNVSTRPYYNIGFFKGPGMFNFCVGRDSFRVELYFRNDSDKKIINAMIQNRELIISNFGKEITFERLENKKASRIRYDLSNKDFGKKFRDESSWAELIQWYHQSMSKFYDSVYPIWEKVQKEL